MSLPQGINFRATVGFVTDGPNDFAETSLASANYPTVSTQGNNVGWEQATSGTRDRVNTNDPRLAGLNYCQGINAKYRIDLPSAGDYNIRLAAGDGSYSQPTFVELFDGTTSLGTLATGVTSGANQFMDATNTEYSAANWPGSNTKITKTFASTICRFSNGNAVDTDMIAHAYVEAAGGGAAIASAPVGGFINPVPLW